MAVAGGLRARYIQDSFYKMVHESLELLGWFDGDRYHTPITMIGEDIPFETEIPLNTLTVSWGDYFSDDIEMGTTLAEHNYTGYVDFYAEDDSVGQHLIYDCVGICAGRMTSIGRDSATFPVFDLSMVAPPVIFVCELENIQVDRARNFPKPWMRHWWSMQFRVLDEHADEND